MLHVLFILTWFLKTAKGQNDFKFYDENLAMPMSVY